MAGTSTVLFPLVTRVCFGVAVTSRACASRSLVKRAFIKKLSSVWWKYVRLLRVILELYKSLRGYYLKLKKFIKW